MDGKKPMPSDPARRAVFQVQIARMQDKQEKKESRKQEAAAAPAPIPSPAGPAASDSAKTGAELAAAAVASPDPTPSTAADGNSMNSQSMNSASANAKNAVPAGEMSMVPADPKPAPADDAEAHRREERLYADLNIQALIDLAPDRALQESDGDVDRRESGVRRLPARRQGSGFSRRPRSQAERNAAGHEQSAGLSCRTNWCRPRFCAPSTASASSKK